MKILIGYDGSNCANEALEDLPNAALTAGAEVLVLTITENWMLILKEMEIGTAVGKSYSYENREIRDKLDSKAAEDFATAENLARTAAERIKRDFPHWIIQSRAVADFPEHGIVEQAKKYQPDLIFVGSHGRGALGRFIFGSVSQKILTESLCSVRIARRAPERAAGDDSPTRLIIGLDGSPDSYLAVDAAAKRSWRKGSAVRLVTAIEPISSPFFEIDLQKAEEARNLAARKLESAGLHVSMVTRLGAARYVLVSEAETWRADAIFLGARGHRWSERVLLGSVSYSVAARAACTVEVVRENLYSPLNSENSEM